MRCKGTLVDLSTPKVMGILNVTPDSFYDGGKYFEEKTIINKVELMLSQGADFIDIGGYSTRPNANDISMEEELQRVLPVIKLLTKHFPEALFSIDTFRSLVAIESINAGACLINDVSGGNFDNKMFETVRNLQVPYVLMHIQGTPQTMQQNPHYTNVTNDVVLNLSEKYQKLKLLGVNDVIIDPGFGFGKTLNHNYQLLKDLKVFEHFNCPVMVGVSRKSMVTKLLNLKPIDALNGTTALHMLALLNGANILRVHDVLEAKQSIEIYKAYRNG